MKKLSQRFGILLALLALPLLSYAADNVFYTNLAANLTIVIGIIVIAATIGVLVNLLNQIVKIRELEILKEQGVEEYAKEKEVASKESWWKKLNKSLTDAVPVEKEEDILLNHEYDGIRELDNNLPPWWLYGFYLTIGISIFYIGFYHFSSYAVSSQEAYEIEMQEAEESVERYLATQAVRIDETNVTLLTDAAALADGETVFNTLCTACHLQGGGGAPGSVGPNLTDQYWIHGGSLKDVFKTVKYGVPEKGMIAWKDQLRPDEIHKVSSYIMSLQGTNPPNAKEPQGELYTPEEELEETPEEAEGTTGE
jgi:cytochrome c oxidase cbb3-type subunit 3